MDPERERMRLAEQYAVMNDLELEDLACDWESLTDAARLALKDEMARRGLERPEEEPLPVREESPALVDPVVVAEFTSMGRALMAAELLQTGGVRCLLTDASQKVFDPEELARRRREAQVDWGASAWFGPVTLSEQVNWAASFPAGAVTLSVSAADSDSAREVLHPPAEDAPEPEE